MPALELTLYCDIANRRLVKGLTDSSEYQLPTFFHQDIATVTLYMLKLPSVGTLSGQNPYQKVSMYGTTVTLTLFSSDGNATPLSLTATWADNTDGSKTGLLNLNSSGMAALLPTSPITTTSIQAILECNLAGNGQETGFQNTVLVKRQYITSGTPAAVGAATYYTQDQINALFLRLGGSAGQVITLISPDGSHQRIIGCNNDGSGLDDSVTI